MPAMFSEYGLEWLLKAGALVTYGVIRRRLVATVLHPEGGDLAEAFRANVQGKLGLRWPTP